MVHWKRLRQAATAALFEHAMSAAQLRKSSHPIAWVAVGTAIAKTTISRYFEESRGWLRKDLNAQKAVLNFLTDCGVGKPTAFTTRQDVKLRCYKGVYFGKPQGHWAPGPYGGDPEVLITRLWEEHDALSVVPGLRWQDGPCRLAPDPMTALHEPLEKTQMVIGHCLALRAAGKSVAILLDGEPGTGKSEALTQIAQALGGKSIRASLGPKMYMSQLEGICDLTRPDVVILDDIDRGGSTETILSTVDVLLRQGVAILASSNAKEELCDALRRAKRLDLHYVYEGCEKNLFDKVSSGLPREKKGPLEGQPLATALRYVELYTILGPGPADGLLEREKARRNEDPKTKDDPEEGRPEEVEVED